MVHEALEGYGIKGFWYVGCVRRVVHHQSTNNRSQCVRCSMRTARYADKSRLRYAVYISIWAGFRTLVRGGRASRPIDGAMENYWRRPLRRPASCESASSADAYCNKPESRPGPRGERLVDRPNRPPKRPPSSSLESLSSD